VLRSTTRRKRTNQQTNRTGTNRNGTKRNRNGTKRDRTLNWSFDRRASANRTTRCESAPCQSTTTSPKLSAPVSLAPPTCTRPESVDMGMFDGALHLPPAVSNPHESKPGHCRFVQLTACNAQLANTDTGYAAKTTGVSEKTGVESAPRTNPTTPPPTDIVRRNTPSPNERLTGNCGGWRPAMSTGRGMRLSACAVGLLHRPGLRDTPRLQADRSGSWSRAVEEGVCVLLLRTRRAEQGRSLAEHHAHSRHFRSPIWQERFVIHRSNSIHPKASFNLRLDSTDIGGRRMQAAASHRPRNTSLDGTPKCNTDQSMLPNRIQPSPTQANIKSNRR